MRSLPFLIVLIELLSSALLIADEPATPTSDLRQVWSAEYLRFAKEVRMTSKQSADPITLREQPVFKWHNPIREGDTHGDFFVWERARPTFFSYIYPPGGQTRSSAVEVQVLVPEEFEIDIPFTGQTARIDGRQLRQVNVVIEDSEVGATPARRAQQMRTWARKCSATLRESGIDHPLRLLPQPILLLADETDDSDGTQGGLFAMVMGTDPEMMVLLEATPPDRLGKSQWRITPARFASGGLTLSFDGKPIWNSPDVESGGPYYFANGQRDSPLDPR